MTTSTDSVPTPGTARATRAAALAMSDLARYAPTIVPFGLALGVTTVALLPTGAVGAGLFGAAALYAGGSQLTATTLLAGGSTLWAAAATGIALNARLALYGAALAPHFRGQPRWFRLLAPQFVIDASYLAAVGRPVFPAPRDFRRYWAAFAIGLLAVWVGAVSAGLLLAPVLPALPHLSLLALALFLDLLIPRLAGRPALAAALSSAVTTVAVSLWQPTIAVLLGCVVGVLTPRLLRTSRPHGSRT